MRTLDPAPIFLPCLIVHGRNSASTPVRECLDPSRAQTLSTGQKAKYSDLIKDSTFVMANLELLFVTTMCTHRLLCADIQSAFKSMSNSRATQYRGMALAYKSRKGLPTLDRNNSATGKLHPLMQAHVAFGLNDHPQFLSIGLQQCVTTFRRHSKQKVDNYILEFIDNILRNHCYADDLLILVTRPMVMEHARNRHMTIPYQAGTFPTQTEHDKFDLFYEKASTSLQEILCKTLIKVLAFNNFYLKKVELSDRDPQGVHCWNQ